MEQFCFFNIRSSLLCLLKPCSAVLWSSFLDCITNFNISYRNSIYSRVLMFMNHDIWNFDLLWSPILIRLFQHCVSGCDECGRWVNPPHSPTAQKTVSSLKLCLSLCGVEFFYLLWNVCLFQGLNIFCVPKKSFCVVKNKHPWLLYASRDYFMQLLLV
jgi:hypothetical protein